jgi:hypothetical protein
LDIDSGRACWHHIVVENAAGTAHAVPDGEIPLRDDGKTHEVRIELG